MGFIKQFFVVGGSGSGAFILTTFQRLPPHAGVPLVATCYGHWLFFLFTCKQTSLVGGLEHGFYFPFHIWDGILPIDFHIFQDG